MTPEVQQTGIAATLGLNYKLFLAQLINFGLILFVIWKWVYKPLVKAMEERSNKIEQGLKDADVAKEMREATEKEKEKMITEARKSAKEIIESAEADAKSRANEMTANAKQDVERIVTQGKQQLREEQDEMMREAKNQVAELVITATEKVIGEKLDKKKDAELVKSALEDVK